MNVDLPRYYGLKTYNGTLKWIFTLTKGNNYIPFHQNNIFHHNQNVLINMEF